jgi:hypothetical protein
MALLDLLCSAAAAAAPAHPSNHTHAPSHQQQQQHRNTSATAAADIRRFCGISELHKAALSIVAAVLRCGDACWALADVLTALDAAVGGAGPGILTQPDILLQVVLLYCQTEQQLAADLAQQAVQLDAVLLVDVPQQQQQGVAGSGSLGNAVALAAAAAQLPVPSCILHALEKCGRSLPGSLQPDHAAAQWIVAQAAHLPGAARLLLQRWLAVLLPATCSSTEAAAAAAAASGGSGSAAGATQMQQSYAEAASLEQQQQQQQQRQQQQQEERCAAIVTLLLKFPGALQLAVQLARSCLEAKQQQQQQQQQQLVGWLCILTAALQSLGSSSSSAAWDYLSYVSMQGVKGANQLSSSSMRLQQLLLGPSGVLELLKRCLLAAAGSAVSSWRSSLVVWACSSCLLAAVDAAAAAAAAAAAEEAGSSEAVAARLLLQQQLLQYGIQQVSRRCVMSLYALTVVKKSFCNGC